MATAGPLENPSNKKNNMIRGVSQVWEKYKNEDSLHGFTSWQTVNASWEQSTPFYQYDTQNGHFKGKHERKMSALALCGSDHRGRRFIKIQAAATKAEQWKKKWLRWQTKIDLALLCAFSSPHPSLFSIFRAPPGWRKWRKCYCWEGEKRREGEEEGSKKRDNKDWESSGSLERNRRALKAIYRPQGTGGGGAGSGNSAADTGITNNPTRHPVLLWSWAEGKLLWLWRRHQPPISAMKDVLIPYST